MNSKILLITIFLLIFSLGLFAQQQTSDGGYIIAGTTETYIHGTEPDTDILLYKLDASGAKQWRKNFGGGESDYYGHVIQTSDGGYAVCGTSYSYTHGEYDFLVYKLDAAGAKLWRKNFGGFSGDRGRSIVQTIGGGYAVSGSSDTYSNGDGDLLVYRLDAAGNKLWRKNYGGNSDEGGGFIETTSDGGFILCGYSYSYNNGWDDILVYKLDAAGRKLWRKNYGGTGFDAGRAIRQTSDGGYVVAGVSNSYSGPPAGKGVPAVYDFIVYRLDAAGNKLWRKTYGGDESDHCHDIRRTSDGGFMLFGYGFSYTNGGVDFLAYRVDAAGTKLWRKNYGGDGHDFGYKVFATTDGGFILFGEGDSYSQTGMDDDFLVYKVDGSGNKLWRKNYGGDGHEYMVGK